MAKKQPEKKSTDKKSGAKAAAPKTKKAAKGMILCSGQTISKAVT